MGSSQSLTTFDMRGFHSLLAAWATVGALLQRLFAAGALAVDPVRRATEPWMFDRGMVLSAGWANPSGPDGRRVPGLGLRQGRGFLRVSSQAIAIGAG
jgi:hypothetical protein